MDIAVVGSGVAGLGAAWALSGRNHVTLFEKTDRIGGHARTIDVPMGDRTAPVDTGFIVYNERTYPQFTRLLAHLGVATEPSDMSFSVGDGAFTFASNLGALLAHPPTLFSRRSAAIVRGIGRFRSEWVSVDEDSEATLLEHVASRDYPAPFIDDYLLPLAAAVWSGSAAEAASMPFAAFSRFMRNHGLFDARRPRWRTITGGSREYVGRLAREITRVERSTPVLSVERGSNGVAVTTADGRRRFDHVVLATHAPASLSILTDATADEIDILSSFPYAPNRAVVHRDPSFMPSRRTAWSSWNTTSLADGDWTAPVGVTYWMNRLQNLDRRNPLFVTLNPAITPEQIVDDVWFGHPQLTAGSLAAQEQLPTIQGSGGVWHCGAWTGNGFHEDGLQSGLTVAAALGSMVPWHGEVVPASPAAHTCMAVRPLAMA